MNKMYTEVAARLGPEQEVIFEGEQITLDIPQEGIVLENRWIITPLTYPGVSELLWIYLAMKKISDCVLWTVTFVICMCAC